MILTQTDKKILEYLYHNQRESYTKIAKKLNLTRTQVEYNIKKYIESGIIKNFVTFFDMTKFGYNQPVALLVKLKNQTYKTTFIKSIPKANIQSYGDVINKYNLYFNLIFKNNIEMNNILSNVLFREYVSEYKIVETFEMKLYPLKFLNISEKINEFDFDVKENKPVIVTEKDKQILKLLKNNGRIKLIDIAKQTGISSELILYKINQWKKERLILGNKILFNFKMLGYSYAIILFHINNLSEQNKNKIRQIAKANHNITAYGIAVDEPNCYFNLTFQTHEEIEKTFETINSIFKDEEFKSEIIYLKEEEFFDMLPFI